MGAAEDISAPGGLNKTGAGQPLRPEGRAADEEKQSTVELARRRQIDAQDLVNTVIELARRVVRRAIRDEPGIAEAGRFITR